MEEQKKVFDKEMYPEGVNSRFLEASADSLKETFGNNTGIFENIEKRDIAKNKDKIVRLLQEKCALKAGSVIVDVGAGTGLFMEALAEVVGRSGCVYACEISQGFVKLLEERCSSGHLEDFVKVKQTKDKALDLGEALADVVFICDVYHHFEYPMTLMTEINKILKKNGKLCVIDFHRDDSRIWSHPKGWAEKHLRADQETFRKEILQCGFQLDEEPTIDTLTENYIMIFSRSE